MATQMTDSNLIFVYSSAKYYPLIRLFKKKNRKSDHQSLLAISSSSTSYVYDCKLLFTRWRTFLHLVHDSLLSFLKKLLSKFVKIENILEDFYSIDVDK